MYVGATICVKFEHENTAKVPKLIVNGIDKIAAIVFNGQPPSNGLNWSAGDVLTLVWDGQYWNAADAGSASSIYRLDTSTTSRIQQLADSITLEVSGKLGSTASIVMSVDGTKTTQTIDMSGVRSAFANDKSAITISAGAVTFNSNTFVVNSTYFTVTKTGVITATSGKIGGFSITSNSIYNDMMTLASSGLRLNYGSGTSVRKVGLIGTNGLYGNANKCGLNFDLESTAEYMTWAAKSSESDAFYDMKLTYVNKSINVSGGSPWEAGSLHVSCNINMHNYLLKNAYIDPDSGGANGGVSGTINFTKIINANSDGSFRYQNGCSMQFKRGLLVGATW